MPDTTVSKTLRATWLLELCEEHVKKYSFNRNELTSLITVTTELDTALNNDSCWTCRADSCEMKRILNFA